MCPAQLGTGSGIGRNTAGAGCGSGSAESTMTTPRAAGKRRGSTVPLHRKRMVQTVLSMEPPKEADPDLIAGLKRSLDAKISAAARQMGVLEVAIKKRDAAEANVEKARAALDRDNADVAEAERAYADALSAAGRPAPRGLQGRAEKQRAANIRLGKRLLEAVGTVELFVSGEPEPKGPSKEKYEEEFALLRKYDFHNEIAGFMVEMEGCYAAECTTAGCPHKGRTLYNCGGYCHACDKVSDYTFKGVWDEDREGGKGSPFEVLREIVDGDRCVYKTRQAISHAFGLEFDL